MSRRAVWVVAFLVALVALAWLGYSAGFSLGEAATSTQ